MTLAAVAPRHELVPGLALATVGVAVAWLVHLALPPVALLTAAVLAGVGTANVVVLPESTRAGLGFAGKHLMRAGVVLLGLQVSLSQIVGLGWQTVAMTLVVLFTTFFGTQWIGRRLGLSDRLSLLVASGFAICGASAVAAVSGAMGGAKDDDEDTVTAVALVALCGSMAIAVLPVANHVLGLSPHDFGRWAGASVHDVGQVVATASIVGPTALAPAVAVKLIRVAMLAPITAGVGATHHRHRSGQPLLPLFVAGFLTLILVRTTGVVPGCALDLAHSAQDLLFAFALFGLGAFVRIRTLLGTGRRALLLGLDSWALIAAVSYVGILLTS